MTDIKTGLALLREPFAPEHVSKLPKPTKKQTDDVKADFTKGIRCAACGAWHHKDVVHLDYVGHAALTHRLLDCDPEWNWEPVSLGSNGLPALDQSGGMWIRLTVCGVTRMGYGSADGKAGGDAVKELIGDALRNAAMRFGAALDLWHKGDLHLDADNQEKPPAFDPKAAADRVIATLQKQVSLDGLHSAWEQEKDTRGDIFEASKDEFERLKKAAADCGEKLKTPPSKPSDSVDDEIPF